MALNTYEPNSASLLVPAQLPDVHDDPTIAAILEAVCRITGMGFAAVARVTDARWQACQVLDRIEFGLVAGEELAIKTTICDEIRKTGNAVIIDDVSASADWRTHHTPMMYGFESYASFPIILPGGGFFGTLCAIDPQPRAVSAPVVVEMLAFFADRIAVQLAGRESPASKPYDSGRTAMWFIAGVKQLLGSIAFEDRERLGSIAQTFDATSDRLPPEHGGDVKAAARWMRNLLNPLQE